MQIEHVVVSNEELTQVEEIGDRSYLLSDRSNPGIPRWAILAFSPAVVLLPLLCGLVLGARITLRHRSVEIRNAWAGYFLTLLMISGALSSIALAAFLSLPRMPAVPGTTIADFDARENYPQLPFWGNLQSSEVSIELKPLVIVVSPISRLWGGRVPASTELGAGVLLLANKDGYLFATASRMVRSSAGMPRQVMISTAAGMRASAEVVASAEKLDLALLWVSRHAGHAVFSQPIGKPGEGEPVFVIGHPDGFVYTLSTATVSAAHGTEVRVNAIGPGNAGGPVYDVHGNLVGIVHSKSEGRRDGGNENQTFATAAEMLGETSGWHFAGDGGLRLQQYIQALNAR